MTTATLAGSHAPLVDRLWPAEQTSALRWAVLVVFGSLLLTASAKVSVPMYPVPMTMQSFAVLVIGMAYGRRLAAVTVCFYLLQGAFGLPVFAGTPERGLGLPYMAGPTGGYLAGFWVAAWTMGWLAERGWDRTIPWAIAAMVVGTIILFIFGVGWLAIWLGWSEALRSSGVVTLVEVGLAIHFGWDRAIAAGLTPFLVGSVVKLALAAALLPLTWKAVEGRSR